jgi:hypothetical protein
MVGLDEVRRQELLNTERYREVRPLLATTYERGFQQGIQEGILQGKRQVLLWMLEGKFGSLAPEVRQRVETLSAEQLEQLAQAIFTAQSLKDLHLQD